MSPLTRLSRGWVLELICPQGVAPKRMPKADATGMAPKKSATSPLLTAEGFRFVNPAGSQGRQPPHLTACRGATPCPAEFAGQGGAQRWAGSIQAGGCRLGVACLHFFGESSERRPWAMERDDRRAAFARRSLFEFVRALTGRMGDSNSLLRRPPSANREGLHPRALDT